MRMLCLMFLAYVRGWATERGEGATKYPIAPDRWDAPKRRRIRFRRHVYAPGGCSVRSNIIGYQVPVMWRHYLQLLSIGLCLLTFSSIQTLLEQPKWAEMSPRVKT